MRRITNLIGSAALLASVCTVAATGSIASAATANKCGQLTLSAIKSYGFTKATGPKITQYNFTKSSANAANALGETIDFGAKALVISCVTPSDIAKLSVQAGGKKTWTAQQYMNWMVKDSAGAMKATPTAGTTSYLDFGNGKEDGLGSTVKSSSVRLDAFVFHSYIIMVQTAPVSAKPSAALTKFIKAAGMLF